MYNTSANDLEQVANDLSSIAQKYTAGSQELDQQVITLGGAVSHVLSSGTQGWEGLSSEAFVNAWQEREKRLQQASHLLSQGAGYLNQMVTAIENNLPAIRADENVMHQSVFQTLGADDQSSIMNEMSQAQNAIFMAISVFNSQLETLAEEVNDCPEVDRKAGDPAYYDNISKNDAGGEEAGGKTPEQRIGDVVDDPVIAQQLIDLAKQNGVSLEELANLLEKGIEPGTVAQLINDGKDLSTIAADTQTLLNGGVRADVVNNLLANGNELSDAIAVQNRGGDLNLIGTSDKVGDFTNLKDASVNEIISRIPKNAKIVEWIPSPAGTGMQDGMKFQWTDENGVTWNVRLHGPNLNAPPGSDSRNGWIMRVERGTPPMLYFLGSDGNFYPALEVTPNNPDGTPNPFFQESAMRITHIRIQNPVPPLNP